MGKGLFLGVELVLDQESKKPAVDEARMIKENLLSKGIILSGAGICSNCLKMTPSLFITTDLVDSFLKILNKTIGEVQSRRADFIMVE